MIVNITCDHRIVYGAHAAEFLQVGVSTPHRSLAASAAACFLRRCRNLRTAEFWLRPLLCHAVVVGCAPQLLCLGAVLDRAARAAARLPAAGVALGL